MPMKLLLIISQLPGEIRTQPAVSHGQQALVWRIVCVKTRPAGTLPRGYAGLLHEITDPGMVPVAGQSQSLAGLAAAYTQDFSRIRCRRASQAECAKVPGKRQCLIHLPSEVVRVDRFGISQPEFLIPGPNTAILP